MFAIKIQLTVANKNNWPFSPPARYTLSTSNSHISDRSTICFWRKSGFNFLFVTLSVGAAAVIAATTTKQQQLVMAMTLFVDGADGDDDDDDRDHDVAFTLAKSLPTMASLLKFLKPDRCCKLCPSVYLSACMV